MRFRFLLVILLPFLALGLQWLLWIWLSPLAWFLFFPTVFFSARLGGFRGGLVSTGLSAAIVWYFFIPLQYSWRMNATSDILSVGMFILVGCLISEVQDRALQLPKIETRFRQIVDNMSSGVAVYETVNNGEDFLFKDFNSAAEKIEQIAKQDVIGKNVTQVFPGVTDFGILEVFRRVWKTGIAENHPISFYRDERITGWRENYISKLPSGDIVAIYDDVTARKQAEETLKISEATLKQAQHLAGIGNWEWDIKRDRHTWSEEIYHIYGRDPDLPPAAYPEVSEYYTPESWERLSARVEKGLTEGVPYECDAEVIRQNGNHRWITAHGKAIRDAKGEIIYLCSTVQDITERKRLENELKQHRNRLEELVRERTSELEAFTYSVSHDLRSPLRGMDGYAKLLLGDYSEKLDKDGRFMLEQICESAKQMGQLIDDLLTFSRLGRRELDMKHCDMNEIIQKLFLEIQRNHPERNLRLETADLPVCCGDPAMIREVIRNLLENAVKFTQIRDEAVIEMGYLAEIPSNIVYYIKDNGAGFDMQYKDKLFQVFQRLHRMEEFEGSGIGLALVKRIVKRHGGSVWAEGEPNKGATFYFSLPLKLHETNVVQIQK